VFITLRVLLPVIRHKATATASCCQIAGERKKDAGNLPNIDYNYSADTGIRENQEYESAFQKF
jgi:hypothetical protein